MIANNKSRSRLPRQDTEGIQVWLKGEVPEPSIPAGHFEPIQRIHFQVHREEVITTVSSVLCHRIEEHLGAETFADQTAEGIRQGNKDGVQRMSVQKGFELGEGHWGLCSVSWRSYWRVEGSSF